MSSLCRDFTRVFKAFIYNYFNNGNRLYYYDARFFADILYLLIQQLARLLATLGIQIILVQVLKVATRI